MRGHGRAGDPHRHSARCPCFHTAPLFVSLRPACAGFLTQVASRWFKAPQEAQQPAASVASSPCSDQQRHHHEEELPARSVVRVSNLRMSPKVAPPAPLGGLLRKHAVSQVRFTRVVRAGCSCLSASFSRANSTRADSLHLHLDDDPALQVNDMLQGLVAASQAEQQRQQQQHLQDGPALARSTSSSPSSSARSSLSGSRSSLATEPAPAVPASAHGQRHASITSHCLHDVDACQALPWWLDE